MAKRSGQPPLATRRPSANDQLLDRAAFALQMQQPAEAEQLATEVLKASRSDTRALQILAQAVAVQGRAAEAVTLLEKATRRVDDPAIETQLGVALRLAGRVEDALTRLRRVTTRRPPWPAAFLEYASQLASLNRRPEAVTVLQDLRGLLPDLPEPAIQLGHLLMADGKRTAACEVYRHALAQAPDRIDALYALAHALRLEGAYDEAEALFQKVLRVRPNEASARIELGLCLLERGQTDSGVECLRQAARGGPRLYGQTLAALASASHGRFFLRPSDAARFLAMT